VYENKGDNDKMACEKTGFHTKVHPFHDNRQQSSGFFGRKYPDFKLNRAPTHGKAQCRLSSSALQNTAALQDVLEKKGDSCLE
jgi:hypothetical protein